MTVLTASQIKAYAANAGFTGQALNIVTAIALAESGGDTNAVNSSDPSGGSYGLMQINGAHFHSGGTSQACAMDAQCSMNYAFTLWSSQGFEPWGSYDPHSPGVTPAYENYLPTSEQSPLGALPPPGHAPTTPQLPNFTNPFTGAIKWIQDPLRVFKLVGGVALIVISLLFLVVPGVSDTITGTVNKATNAMQKIGK